MLDPASYIALGIALVGALPRLAAVLTRSRGDAQRAEVARFESLYAQQDHLIDRLTEARDALAAQLANECARVRALDSHRTALGSGRTLCEPRHMSSRSSALPSVFACPPSCRRAGRGRKREVG